MVPRYVCIRLCKHGKHCLCQIFYKRNIKRVPCDSLMQKHEREFERTQKFVCGSGLHKDFPVLPNSLESGCIRLFKHSTHFIFLIYFVAGSAAY